MGYTTHVEGEFQIDPPLTWREIEASPFERVGSVYLARGIDLELAVEEQEKQIEEGVAFIRSASRLVMPHISEYWAYTLVEQVQKVLDMFPDKTFSGSLFCEGEENTDIWRVEIHDGRAVRVEPKIMWPEDVEALVADVRAKVLSEIRKNINKP